MQDDQRLIKLKRWLRNDLDIHFDHIAPASSDASFRRYFRIQHEGKSLIVMDAPPEKENCDPFIKISNAMAAMKLNVPRVLQQDLKQGYLLLTDLGNVQYLEKLNATTAEQLYRDALEALLLLQSSSEVPRTLPQYDHALLMQEMELVREWYFKQQLAINFDATQHAVLDQTFGLLVQSALAQPRTWVHRDYHSRNLMVVENNNPGVLDFQDALFGPITYDLASLLKDCYIEWPRAQVLAWVEGYYRRLVEKEVIDEVGTEQFIKWFELMAVQRHLKAIGIFARLNIRDHKPGYLNDIPRTLNYVRDTCRRYPELKPLGTILNNIEPC